MFAYRQKLTFMLSLILFISHGSSVFAEQSAVLDRGRQLFESFEYDRAIEVLEGVIRAPSSTADEKIRALELISVMHLLREDQAQARQTMEQILSLDPGYQITDPDIPPSVHEFFAEVRESFSGLPDVSIDVDAPEAVSNRAPPQIEISLDGDTDTVSDVVVHVRTIGAASYEQAEVVFEGGSYTSELPWPEVGQGLEYYVIVTTASGHELAREGSAEYPRFIDIREEGRSSSGSGREFYKRWWFWTVVGVVVVGGITATAVATTRDEDPPDGTLGSVQMPLSH